MDKNGKNIMYLIESNLQDLFKLHIGKVVNFKRMVFSSEHNLLVVEIEQEQLSELYESLLASNAIKQALIAKSNCSKVDVIDIGRSICFYFWINSDTQSKKIEPAHLEYAI